MNLAQNPSRESSSPIVAKGSGMSCRPRTQSITGSPGKKARLRSRSRTHRPLVCRLNASSYMSQTSVRPELGCERACTPVKVTNCAVDRMSRACTRAQTLLDKRSSNSYSVRTNGVRLFHSLSVTTEQDGDLCQAARLPASIESVWITAIASTEGVESVFTTTDFLSSGCGEVPASLERLAAPQSPKT